MLPGGHLLSVLIFFPAVGALALLLLRGDDHKFIRIIALIVSLAEFLFSLLMIRAVPIGAAGYHLEEYLKWISQPPINYHLGVDGISLFLVILTTFLMPISFVFCSAVKVARPNSPSADIMMAIIEKMRMSFEVLRSFL